MNESDESKWVAIVCQRASGSSVDRVPAEQNKKLKYDHFVMRLKYVGSTSKAPVLTARKSREVVCAAGSISRT